MILPANRKIGLRQAETATCDSFIRYSKKRRLLIGGAFSMMSFPYFG
jgi:hypothetical protein